MYVGFFAQWFVYVLPRGHCSGAMASLWSRKNFCSGAKAPAGARTLAKPVSV